MKTLTIISSFVLASFFLSSCERNENEPEILDQEFYVDENSDEGTIVGVVEAYDQDGSQQITFEITSGNTNDAFTINSNTGVISVYDPVQLDYETTPAFELQIRVSDNFKDDPLEASAWVTIHLNDLDEYTITMKDFSGYVQKGPFINGSSITIYELNEELEQTGRTFNAQIADNQGSYALPGVELHSSYVQLKADGFYYNEVSGELSEAQLTLYSIVDVNNVESTNINILSHLESGRMQYLIEGGMTFAEAKEQARDEIMQVFNISVEGLENSEEMDISKGGDDNARLLALSVILQGGRTTAELAELINNISLDMTEDGTMDNESIGTALINGVNHANLSDVRDHLENRYDELGMVYEIPAFENYVNHFIETSGFLATNQLIYPVSGSHGENFLHPDVKVVDNDTKGSFAVEVPKGRSLQVKAIHRSALWIEVFSAENMDWGSYVEEGSSGYNLFETTSSGLCEIKINLKVMDESSNTVDIEYFEDGASTPSFTKTIQIDGVGVPIDSTLL